MVPATGVSPAPSPPRAERSVILSYAEDLFSLELFRYAEAYCPLSYLRHFHGCAFLYASPHLRLYFRASVEFMIWAAQIFYAPPQAPQFILHITLHTRTPYRPFSINTRLSICRRPHFVTYNKWSTAFSVLMHGMNTDLPGVNCSQSMRIQTPSGAMSVSR